MDIMVTFRHTEPIESLKIYAEEKGFLFVNGGMSSRRFRSLPMAGFGKITTSTIFLRRPYGHNGDI